MENEIVTRTKPFLIHTGKASTCHNDRRKNYRFFTVADKRYWGLGVEPNSKITAKSFVPLYKF
jgi:hypothetical protein